MRPFGEQEHERKQQKRTERSELVNFWLQKQRKKKMCQVIRNYVIINFAHRFGHFRSVRKEKEERKTKIANEHWPGPECSDSERLRLIERESTATRLAKETKAGKTNKSEKSKKKQKKRRGYRMKEIDRRKDVASDVGKEYPWVKTEKDTKRRKVQCAKSALKVKRVKKKKRKETN